MRRRTSMKVVVTHCTAVALLLLASAALADNPEAQSHVSKATAHYNLQEWTAAIDEYKAAYQLEPKNETLWGIAQAQRMSGDCRSATLSYRAFARGASANGAHAADELIKECQHTIEEQDKAAKAALEAPPPPPKPAAPPVSAPAAPPPAKAAEAPHRGPWVLDPLGDVLAVVGVGGLAVGATFLILGDTAMARSTSNADYRAYHSAADAAAVQQTIGVVGLVGGAVFASLAVWRFSAVASRNAKERNALSGVAVSPAQHGGFVSYELRF